MEERRAARVAAAVAGSTGNGGAQSLPSVTGRRVMILARVVGVPGGAGSDRRGWLQTFGVLELAGH